MTNNENKNSVEQFINFQNYQRASHSENSDETCKDCTALFTFKGKTRCYAYEQQRFKDKNLEFHPRRDFNCNIFEASHSFDDEIHYYIKALIKGIDPENDADYQKVLKEKNDYYNSLHNLEKTKINVQTDDIEDWDDPNTYANCSDWEDESENCYHCADDECPMNKG